MLIFFLNANNSVNDQPNGNGSKDKVKVMYDRPKEKWYQRFTTIQFSS